MGHGEINPVKIEFDQFFCTGKIFFHMYCTFISGMVGNRFRRIPDITESIMLI